MPNKIFISYATEDYSYADRLHSFLTQHGFSAWMDKKNLLPGQAWDYYIQQELRKADFVIILLSEVSVNKRGYVQKEFNKVLQYCDEKLETDIYVIPVRIDSCAVPEKLSRFQWIDFSSNNLFDKILESISTQHTTPLSDNQKKLRQSMSHELQSRNKKYELGAKSPKQFFEVEYKVFNQTSIPSFLELNILVEKEILDYEISSRENYYGFLKDLVVEYGETMLTTDSECYGKFSIEILSPNFISYTFYWSVYSTGAAHGYYWSHGHNYYMDPLRKLRLEDLFIDFHSVLTKLRDLLEMKLKAYVKDNHEIELADFYLLKKGFDPIQKNFENFYIKSDAIVFVYNPMHFGAFSYGDQHLSLKWEELLVVFPNEPKLLEFHKIIVNG